MTPTTETAGDVLAACGNEHCTVLHQQLFGQLDEDAALGYEDVFYPLRCHCRDGLVLLVDFPRTETARFVWGPGDLIFEVRDDERSIETAVDPFEVFQELQGTTVGIDAVLVEAEADR